MAFRRRTRRFPRRRRARWDMQTFRDCERALGYDVVLDSTCANPQTVADLVCGPIASTASPMVAGATSGLMYGGGHLQVRYNTAILATNEGPCSHSIKVVTALVVLPLLEDDLTPAYLPNLAIARSQLSVVHATQGDTDEDILWIWDEQLDLVNVSCNTEGGDTNCPFDGSSCTSGDETKSWFLLPAIGMFARARRDETLRSRRRLRERQAIFLLTSFVNGGPQLTGNISVWPIRRNVYFRYAVRPSRG